MHSDIFPARHYSNWETVFILEELLGDKVMVPTETESEPLEKKGKYEVRVPCQYFLEENKVSCRKASLLPPVLSMSLFISLGCWLQASQMYTLVTSGPHRSVPGWHCMGITEPSLPWDNSEKVSLVLNTVFSFLVTRTCSVSCKKFHRSLSGPAPEFRWVHDTSLHAWP